MDRICPNCRAALDDDLADRTGGGDRVDCPFCGTNVTALYTGSDVAGTDVATSDGRDETDPAQDWRIPPGGLLTVADWTDDRLVIAIPPGGSGMAGIGCFAIAWLGITGVVSAGFLAAGIANPGWEMLFPFAILSLFWIIGLVMLYAWLRSRYLTTYLLLERDRLAVQRILFGRKSTTITTLNHDCRAKLATSYSQNDEPVYHVELMGTDRKEKFGLRLGEPEKLWLVRAINGFLHGEEPSASDEDDDGLSSDEPRLRIARDVPREAVDPLRPHELPADSLVRFDDTFADGLAFSLPALTGGCLRNVGAGCGCFGTLWFAFSVLFAVVWLPENSGVVEIVLCVAFGLVGLAILLASVALRRARIRVEIDNDGLRLRWGFGRLAVTQYVPLASITHIGLGTTMESSTNGRVTFRGIGALLRAGGQSYPLTTDHGEEVGRQVAGLVRAALEDRGVRLEEIAPPEDA